MMNQIKYYKFAIWGLVLLNLSILAFFIFLKPLPPHLRQGGKEGPTKNKFEAEAIAILKLNDKQKSILKNLAKEHNKELIRIKDEQEKILLPYFENLLIIDDLVKKVELPSEFQKLEVKKIEITYQYFEEIKDLLNKEQTPYFSELMKKFIDQILLSKNGKPDHPR